MRFFLSLIACLVMSLPTKAAPPAVESYISTTPCGASNTEFCSAYTAIIQSWVAKYHGNPDLIIPGQQFALPDGSTYTVTKGDNLWSITEDYQNAANNTQAAVTEDAGPTETISQPPAFEVIDFTLDPIKWQSPLVVDQDFALVDSAFVATIAALNSYHQSAVVVSAPDSTIEKTTVTAPQVRPENDGLDESWMVEENANGELIAVKRPAKKSIIDWIRTRIDAYIANLQYHPIIGTIGLFAILLTCCIPIALLWNRKHKRRMDYERYYKHRDRVTKPRKALVGETSLDDLTSAPPEGSDSDAKDWHVQAGKRMTKKKMAAAREAMQQMRPLG